MRKYAQIADAEEAADSAAVTNVLITRNAPREITVRDLVLAMRQRVLLCTIIVLTCTAIAVVVAIAMTPVYQAEVLLFPVDRESDSSSVLQKFGGLAALAGMKPSGGKQSELAVATLRSREFAAGFIEQNSLINELVPEPTGVRKLLQSVMWHRTPPNIDSAVKVFLKRVQNVDVDPDTGVVKLTIEFRDRLKVADWANQIVARINDRMRNSAITQSRLRLEFLNAELAKTTVVGVQAAIFNLIESETKGIMMANTERDFAFHPVERAVPPPQNDFVRPQRALLTISGALAGIVLSVVICLFVAAASANGPRVA